MAGSLGTLSIDLVAKTGGFTKNVRKAESDLEGFARQAGQTESRVQRATRQMRQHFNRLNQSVDRLSRGLGSVAAPAAAAGAALVALAVYTADAAQEARNMARALGTSAETLQRWQYILGRVGITGEQVATMFKDLSDKVGEFLATGGGEAAEVFKRMGIGAEQLRGKKPQEVLLLIADALKQVNSQAERVFLMEALADDASKALPILMQGAGAIKAMGQEATNLNVALSKLELKKLVKMDQAFYGIWQRLKGLANTFSVQLSPAIQAFAKVLGRKEVAGALEQIATWLGKIVGLTVTAISKILKYFGIIGRWLGSSIGDYMTSSIDEQIPKLTAKIEQAQEAQKRLNAEMKDMAAGSRIYEQTQKAYLEQGKQVEGMKTQLQQLKKQQQFLESIGAGSELYRRGFLDDQNQTVTVTTNVKTDGGGYRPPSGTAGITAGQAMADAQQRAAEMTKQHQQAVMDLRRSLATTDERARMRYDHTIARINGTVTSTQLATQLKMRAWARYQQAVHQGTNNISQFAIKAARNIQDALGTTLERTLKGSFDSIGKLWLDLITRMATQAAAVNLGKVLLGDKFGSSGKIGGLIGSLFGGSYSPGTISTSRAMTQGLSPAAASGAVGASGGSWIGTAVSALGSLFGGFFAKGGQLPAGKWSVVGERGPELVTPGGHVIPNGAAIGGVVVNNNVTYNEAPGKTPTERDTDRGQFMRDLEQTVKGVMLKDVAERGEFSRGLQGVYGLTRQGAT